MQISYRCCSQESLDIETLPGFFEHLARQKSSRCCFKIHTKQTFAKLNCVNDNYKTNRFGRQKGLMAVEGLRAPFLKPSQSQLGLIQ